MKFDYEYIDNELLSDKIKKELISLFGKKYYINIRSYPDGCKIEIGKFDKVKIGKEEIPAILIWGTGKHYNDAIHEAMTRMLSGIGPEGIR
jgi:hypothetical protein